MNNPCPVAIIGTGFLGRGLADKFSGLAVPLTHTFNKHRYFSNSIHLDFFPYDMVSVLTNPGVELVIFASRSEDCPGHDAVLRGMERNLPYLKHKRVIYTSSDAVFDGRKGMYSEDDRPAPLTVYGRNKLVCEKILRDSIPNHCIVRTSYIYGLAQAKQQLEAGKAFHRFEDMYKSPFEEINWPTPSSP